MNKAMQGCAVISAITLWILISLCVPWVFCEKNSLLVKFINEQMLSFLGIIVTITLAFCTNLYLTLNGFEEKIKKEIFINTKAAIRKSSYWLIAMLFLALILLSIKSLILDNYNNSERAASFVNGGGLLIVIFNILILVDLMQMIFKVPPQHPKLVNY